MPAPDFDASPTDARSDPWRFGPQQPDPQQSDPQQSGPGPLLNRFGLRPVVLIVLTSLCWMALFNLPMLRHAMELAAQGTDSAPGGLMLSLTALVVAAHAVLLGTLGVRQLLKPLIVLLTLSAAAAVHFIEAYGVMLDPSMLRNVLATHPAEARELLTGALLGDLAIKGALPAVVLAGWPLRRLHWPRALLERSVLLGAMVVLIVLSVWSAYQPLSSLMRQHRELRYLITPANLVWSSAAVLRADTDRVAQAREPIGLDARPGPSWAQRTRPLVVLWVLGETARAADWGLNSGARDTTPQLRELPVVNFPQVVSCGTNTEVSVPCMFAPVGRRDYDEARIRRQESLLHVLHRAGVQVHWLDNQSGCKGVCDGLPQVFVKGLVPQGCPEAGCLDDRLVSDLPQRLEKAQGTQLWVMHMLGNHGPSYHRRYPARFEHFKPACHHDDLHRCSIEEVVNAYDNALRFTDHVLAQAIQALSAVSDRMDVALVYVSDHGESLGEKGLFLHGLPYRIAPREQTRVPMVWWLGPRWSPGVGLSVSCAREALEQAARSEVAHDHLFHTMLGLLDVRTALHEPSLDFFHPCRPRP
jgi:lipid A ethanolaminephosphotransferase